MKRLFIGILLIFSFNLVPNNGFANALNQNSILKTKSAQRIYNDPNFFAQEYANQHGISLDEAKNELRKKYGEPKTCAINKMINKNPFGLNPQEQELLEAGIPVEVIREGDDSIMNFIVDNKISDFPRKEF